MPQHQVLATVSCITVRTTRITHRSIWLIEPGVCPSPGKFTRVTKEVFGDKN